MADVPNGWRGLQGILTSARAEFAADQERPYVDCPNDGQPLLVNVKGITYCPYDGWRPPGQPSRNED